MPTTLAYPNWLIEFEPRLPLDELVEETNKIFHEFEARYYDGRHPETTDEWVSLWKEMIAVGVQAHRGVGVPPACPATGGTPMPRGVGVPPATDSRTGGTPMPRGVGVSPARGVGVPPASWRILDFGCGTGFASEQLLHGLPAEAIAGLTCYDLSSHMLAQCQAKIGKQFPAARFCYTWDELEQAAPFNLLATNSLLHHVPDPADTMRRLLPLCDENTIWLAGHEPSNRFYRNAECMRLLTDYRQSQKQRWWRYLSPATWQEKVSKLLRRQPSPKKRTAVAAHERGLFGCRPTPRVIDRLVDFHVPHSSGEVEQGRGFDFEVLQQTMQDHWDMVWVKTYSFLGSARERSAPRHWQRQCRALADRFPNDGANFAMVWRRL